MLQHNTCPICRKTLGTAAAGAEEPNVGIHEITDATDSDSTDSSDNDVDSDGSNDELGDSAAIASSSAADGGEDADPGADEPMESVADIPDCTLWDIRPDGSVRLSTTRQTEEDDRHRCSSSSKAWS